MTKPQKQLLLLIRSAMGDKNLTAELQNLSVEEKKEIVSYAQAQGCIPFLQFFDIFTKGEMKDLVFPSLVANVYENARQQAEIESLLNVFEKNGIYCIPLKGIRTKKMYPQEELRTMGDLDILYRQEQTELLRKVMSDIGYTTQGDSSKHDHYEKAGRIVEMHKDLLPAGSKGYKYFQKIWERAAAEDGKIYCWQMALEDHYLFTLYHLIEHFIRGGIGIRMVLDIYVISHRPELDMEKVRKELEYLGIDIFEENIRNLAECWFGATKTTPEQLQELEDYVLNGGIFGSRENEEKNAGLMYKTKSHFLRYIIFPPYEVMRSVFPWLNTPLLLPAAWVKRWWNVWTKRRGNIQSQLSRAEALERRDMSEEEMRKEFFEKYGLKF
mgnify:FL=1